MISAVKVVDIDFGFSVSQRLRGEIGLVAAPALCGKWLAQSRNQGMTSRAKKG